MKRSLLTVTGSAGALRPPQPPKQIAVVLAVAMLASIPAFSEDHPQSGKNYKFEFSNRADTTQGYSSFGNFGSSEEFVGRFRLGQLAK
jgi:hypothetical protein